MTPQRPTILDVAKEAGVGIGTVSRVLNNSPQVSQETRERVQQAIKTLHFKPNIVARQLPRKKRLRNIGVITQPFLTYHSFVERLRGVQKALSAAQVNYELVLYNVSSPENWNERLLTLAAAGPVEGLLIIDLLLSDAQRDALRQAHMPFVGINHLQDSTWPVIRTDNVAGGYLATEHLIALGHRRIAFLGDHFLDAYDFNTSAERCEGYKQALDEHTIEVDEALIFTGAHGFDSAKALAADLLALPELPTALFAMSDIQALGCIAAIREAGLRVPEDISVIGYDDLEMSTYAGLTTVRQHLETGGRLGLEYLLRLINKREPGPVPTMPPLEVIVRETTRPLH